MTLALGAGRTDPSLVPSLNLRISFDHEGGQLTKIKFVWLNADEIPDRAGTGCDGRPRALTDS